MKKIFFIMLSLFAIYLYAEQITIEVEVCGWVTYWDKDCHWEDVDTEDEYGNPIIEIVEICGPPIKREEWECSTSSMTFTVPDGSSPEDIQSLIDDIETEQNIANLDAFLSGENSEGNNEESNRESRLSEDLQRQLDSQAETARNAMQEKANQSNSSTANDPVRVALGSFVTTDNDIYYSFFDEILTVERFFDTNNKASHSLGYGWSFNYDMRIIRSANPGFQELVTKRHETFNHISALYTESLNKHNSALNRLSNLISDLEILKNDLENTVLGLEDSYSINSEQEIRSIISSRISNVNNTIQEVNSKINDAKATLLTLQDTYINIENMERLKNEEKEALDLAIDHADLSIENLKLNKFAVNNTDLSLLQFSGIESLIFMDGQGNPTIYTLDVEPDYNSTAFYADGYINYWPQGSSSTALFSTDDELSLLPDGGFRLLQKDGEKRFFDFYGRLSVLEDRNGNRIEFTYEENKIVITDGFDREMIINRDSQGRIVAILDPMSRTVAYSYDGAGHLSSVTDADGDMVRYEYYDQGEIEKIIKPDDSFIHYFYTEIDGRRVVDHVINEEGETEYMSYDFINSHTTATSVSGDSTTHHFDDKNRETHVIYEDGSYEEKVWDDNNNLTGYRSRSGYWTYYTYDDRNNVTQIDHPDGTNEAFTFNQFSQVVESLDSDKNRSIMEYDQKGNLLSRQVFNDRGDLKEEISFTYTPEGLIRLKNLGRSGDDKILETYSYDDWGNLSSVVDGEGNLWQYTYDMVGNLVQVIDPLGSTTDIEYTPMGYTARITFADGSQEETAYSDRKDRDSFIDREGFTYDYTYDKSHKLISIENPLAEMVTFTHRPTGEETSKTIYSAEGEIESFTEYIYNNYGELSSIKIQLDDSTFAETSYKYFNGLLWKVTAPEGTMTEYLYDSRDRVKTRRIIPSDGTGTVEDYFSYTGNGRIAGYTDPRGFETEYQYSPAGEIEKITNPDGTEKTFEYDGLNRLIRVEDEEGFETRYTYNGINLPEEIIAPDGTVEFRRYNEAGHLISITDGNDHETRYETDELGRVVKVILPEPYDNAFETYTYNSRSQVLTYTDANGNSYTNEYDPLGNLIRTVDPEGNETAFSYTPLGQRESILTADGAEWTNQYDMTGRQIAVIDPLGAITGYGYDKQGRLLSKTDPMNRLTTYDWDGLGHLIEINQGNELISKYGYDAAGNRISETIGTGVPYIYEYDSLNRLERETNRLGISQNLDYYDNGKLKTKIDFNGDRTEYFYNDANRMALVKFADGKQKSFAYDGVGNLTSAINEVNSLTYSYDGMNRLSGLEDLLTGETVSYDYDPVGNRTGLTWGNGRSFSYTYSPRNELLTLTDPEGLTTSYSYDAMGREIEKLMPNGILENRIYDPAGRLLSIAQKKENNSHRSHWYQTANVLNGQAYVYNRAGQKTFAVDERGVVTAYEYDPIGRIDTVYYGDLRDKASLDFRERLEMGIMPEVTPNGKGNSRKSRDTLFGGDLSGDGLGFDSEELVQELMGQFETFTGEESFGDMRGNFNWNWGNGAHGASSFHQKLNLNQTQEEEISEAYDLINPRGWGQNNFSQSVWKESFTYDDNNNITTKTNGWGEIPYSYNAENQLQSSGNRFYDYDNNGNQITEGVGPNSVAYGYNAENRLSSVYTDTPAVMGFDRNRTEKGVYYGYDALGRRTLREEYTEAENGKKHMNHFGDKKQRELTLYDGLSFDYLAEGYQTQDYSGYGDFNPVSEYAYGNGQLVSETSAQWNRSLTDYNRNRHLNKQYYSLDSLGSVAMITGKNGQVTETYGYDVYGKTYEGNLTGSNSFGYNGKPMDAVTGLYDYGFRDYAPQQMRFSTVDPIRDGLNWYAYVGNDPINRIDPDGLAEIYADDIHGAPIVAYEGRDLKSETSINIQRDSNEGYYNDTLSVNIGNQTVYQAPIQSEADWPGYEDDTLTEGARTGTLYDQSGHYDNAILIDGNDTFIHPDKWTTDKYINDPDNGPWSQPLSQNCQIMQLDDFNSMTSELEGLGFNYDYQDNIEVTIQDDKKNK